MSALVSTDLDAMLEVVGARPDEVAAAATTHGGEPYLVGSLAAGVGDGRSDIDVHVVTAGALPSDSPILAFTSGGACIDIRYVRRSAIDRMLGDGDGDGDGRPEAGVRPAGRVDTWMLSRWLNAVPFRAGAPPLLTAGQRERARNLVIRSLVADVVSLASFAALAERAGAARAWYLCRRAGVVAWELAATLTGKDYLGERWLPARSTAPRVAAFAAIAAAVERTDELDRLLELLGIAGSEVPGRVRLMINPEAERWTLADGHWLLVAGRRLVPQVDPVPETVADALDHAPSTVFAGLANGALRWTVDVSGISPSLKAIP